MTKNNMRKLYPKQYFGAYFEILIKTKNIKINQ